ncbi:MAG: thioredoxin domain-containing protein, partial [Propionibacteriaceae bacterium]|nr:thioredoxin domain-containing protein [Propionibacteriaceae bacterium]
MSTSAPAPATPPTKQGRPAWQWALVWALSVVLAFLLGLQVRSLMPDAPPSDAPAPASPTAQTAAPNEPAETPAQQADPQLEQFLLDLPRREAGDPLALGEVDAKVVLTNWSDYRCPFCAVWHQRTMPALSKYVDDGTLRIEFRDLSLFGEQSDATAAAARAAGQQGKFWEFQDAVFAAAPPSGHPDIPRDKLIDFARTAGVPDIAAFEAALDDPALAQAVAADTSEAHQLGVSSTPFFVIGGQAFSGA